MEYARATYQKERAFRELEDSSVISDRLTPEHDTSLRELLDMNPQESDLHSFLNDHPEYLVQILGGGHGRYQLSKK